MGGIMATGIPVVISLMTDNTTGSVHGSIAEHPAQCAGCFCLLTGNKKWFPKFTALYEYMCISTVH
jgi:hypothetical protein